jgi:hypothetical protein
VSRRGLPACRRRPVLTGAMVEEPSVDILGRLAESATFAQRPGAPTRDCASVSCPEGTSSGKLRRERQYRDDAARRAGQEKGELQHVVRRRGGVPCVRRH